MIDKTFEDALGVAFVFFDANFATKSQNVFVTT